MHDLAVVACKLRKKAGLVGSLVIGHVGMVERIRTFPFWRPPERYIALVDARTVSLTAMPPFLIITDSDVIRTVTMTNPGRRNAVPEASWSELTDAFNDFERSGQRVLVLRGSNGDFCAGSDMNKSSTRLPSAADTAATMRVISRAVTALHRLTKPTIAAVDGVAVGAGFNMAIGCDIVIATDRARFAEIFVKRGLTLDFGGTWLLPRLIGLARARELALTGRIIGAAEALDIGLVSSVVAVEDLDAAVTATATQLAAGAPLAQAMIKRALGRSSEMSFEQALAFEEHAQAILLASDDLQEGAAAFIEKREPKFKGR
jgi:enoyl-CoA hydratase/carnithine racemase